MFPKGSSLEPPNLKNSVHMTPISEAKSVFKATPLRIEPHTPSGRKLSVPYPASPLCRV